MAHTDKDAPQRVRDFYAEDASERHAVGCPNDPLGRTLRAVAVPYLDIVQRDDIRISPTTGLPYAKRIEAEVTRYRREYVEVTHECDIDSVNGLCSRRSPYRYHCEVTAADRRLAYYGPERAYARVMLSNAVRDYNTHGDTDIEPEPIRHRHGPWRHGYWD